MAETLLSISDYFNKIIMSKAFNISEEEPGEYGSVNRFYLGLGTNSTNPSIGTTGNIINFTEVNNNYSYSRVEINTDGHPLVFLNDSCIITNSTNISFPRSTGYWGIIKYWGLYDSETGGNLLAFGRLFGSNNTITRTIDASTTVTIVAEGLKIGLNKTLQG